MSRVFFILILAFFASSYGISANVPLMSACFKGGELVIASNDGKGAEMCYCFKPCMANLLFSFSHVGTRQVSRLTSDCTTVMNDKSKSWLNIATSDNIGPVAVKGYYNYVGGNHLWKRADSKGQKGAGKLTSIFTARTDSFAIRADGERLQEAALAECHKVTVDVWNTLFDPLVDPPEGAAMLSSPLITEHVTYTVEYNTINVTVEHKYLKKCTISRYNGMQSMFRNEVSVMTPDAVYTNWTAKDSIYRFARKKYPRFSHFIERNASGWCQNTLLYPTDLGNHEFLPENYAIFLYTSDKCYHVVMCNKQVAKGEVRKWDGSYVWCKPDIDNDFVTITRGMRNSRTLLAVDTKRAGTYTFPRPEWWTMFDELIPGDGVAITTTDKTVTINSTKATGAVLLAKTSTLYERGDVNGDGNLDVADMTLLIDMVLGKGDALGLGVVADLNGDGQYDVCDVNLLVDIILGK